MKAFTFMIVGTLGRDFERKEFDGQDGKTNAVFNSSVAIRDGYSKRSADEYGEQTTEWVDQTKWLNIYTWDERIGKSMMRFFGKGKGIILECAFPEARGYADNNTGEIKANVRAKIVGWQFLPGKKEDSGGSSNRAPQNDGPEDYDYAPPPKDPDDIPF